MSQQQESKVIRVDSADKRFSKLVKNSPKNEDFSENLINTSKRAANFMLAGGAVGIVWGLYYHKNLLLSTFIGSIAGGLLGVAINKITNKN